MTRTTAKFVQFLLIGILLAASFAFFWQQAPGLTDAVLWLLGCGVIYALAASVLSRTDEGPTP